MGASSGLNVAAVVKASCGNALESVSRFLSPCTNLILCMTFVPNNNYALDVCMHRRKTMHHGISLGSRPSPFTHAYISKRMRYPDSGSRTGKAWA